MASHAGIGDLRPTSVPQHTTPLRQVRVPHTCARSVRLSALSRVPYFRALDEQELEQVDARVTRHTWAAGENLFREGDAADALFVVAEGRVKLSQVRADGSTTVLDILTPGETAGAMGIVGEPTHRQTATALVDTCSLSIGQLDFRELLVQHPHVALHVLDDVSGRLARAQSDIGGQVTQTVPARVATALLRLADKIGNERPNGVILLEVPLSRADLGGLALSTPESVSRVMSRWKREGLITSGRRWVALRDRDRLQRIADEVKEATDT